MKNKNVAVIGGGPAGMIAAKYSSKRGNNTTLFEKNEKLGKKLFITGKGRCNITNNQTIDIFINNVMRNKEFLYSSFYSFTNVDIINLLEENGLPTKVERGQRIFPKSDKSSDVIRVFEKLLKENKVNVKLNSPISCLKKEKDKFILKSKGREYYFDKVILATGGFSYPKTGSTGDGHQMAEVIGHNISDISGSLVPINIKENYIKELVGLSLRNVKIKLYDKNKEIYSDLGDLVFTHYGISGPIVLTLSSFLNDYNLKTNYKIKIDLKPGLSQEKLNNRILRDFEKYNNKILSNALDDLLPKKIIMPVINLAKIDPNKVINQVSREERYRLINIIKGFPMTFQSLRNVEEAIITKGGILTEEINPSTMESKLVKGLYFAGEIIDVDALTGGYNLQIAYSTGFLAGNNV